MTEPQTAPRCHLDGRPLTRNETRTCRDCIDRTRTLLHAVHDLYALLPAETVDRGGTTYDRPQHSHDTPIPGGEAMTMLAPGSDGRHQTHDILTGRLRIGETQPAPHVDDEWAADPTSVSHLLTWWEDDWRHTRGDPASDAPPDQAAAAAHAYLLDNLEWAARHHPELDTFVADMRRTRTRLAAATRTDQPRTRSQARCLADSCTGQLERLWDQPRGCHHPAPCDQCDHGGRRETWECPACGRTYTEAQHWVAVTEELAARRALQVQRLEAS